MLKRPTVVAAFQIAGVEVQVHGENIDSLSEALARLEPTGLVRFTFDPGGAQVEIDPPENSGSPRAWVSTVLDALVFVRDAAKLRGGLTRVIELESHAFSSALDELVERDGATMAFCRVCGMETERQHIGERWVCCNDSEHAERVQAGDWLLANRPPPAGLPVEVEASVMAWNAARVRLARVMVSDLQELYGSDPGRQQEAMSRMPAGFETWPEKTRRVVYFWCREVERRGDHLVGLLRGAASDP